MKRWKQVMIICAALGWWGAIYPQFTMVKGTYGIIGEESLAGSENGGDIYWEIMDADRSHIRVKSRLLIELRSLRDHLQGVLAQTKGD